MNDLKAAEQYALSRPHIMIMGDGYAAAIKIRAEALKILKNRVKLSAFLVDSDVKRTIIFIGEAIELDVANEALNVLVNLLNGSAVEREPSAISEARIEIARIVEKIGEENVRVQHASSEPGVTPPLSQQLIARITPDKIVAEVEPDEIRLSDGEVIMASRRANRIQVSAGMRVANRRTGDEEIVTKRLEINVLGEQAPAALERLFPAVHFTRLVVSRFDTGRDYNYTIEGAHLLKALRRE